MEAMQAPEQDSGHWWVFASIGIGTFMSALDGSVVNSLLPVMRVAFQATVAEIEWVVTIYLLVVSGVLLGFGRLGDLRGHKSVYVAGFAGFTLSSALCGLAPSAKWLIAFRGLQAISAAMLFANSPAILTRAFPPQQRGRALGLQATMTYLGLTAGPALGGLLAKHLGWQSVFFINVPVGLAGTFLASRLIARDRPAGDAPPFDRTGAVLFFVALFALMLALNQGHAWGWGAAATLALLGGAAIAFAGFVRLERRQPHPMLDLSLFGQPAFTSSALSALLSYVAMSTIVFLVPFYLIQARGLTPDRAGLLLTAQPIVMMIAAPVAGVLSDRLGTRRLCALGMALLAAGLLLLSQIGPATPLAWVALGLAVCGLGFGAFIAPNNSRLLGAAPRHRQGIASGVMATARNVGMVLGVGLAGAVYTTVLAHAGADAIPQAVARGLQAAGVVALVAMVASLQGRSASAP